MLIQMHEATSIIDAPKSASCTRLNWNFCCCTTKTIDKWFSTLVGPTSTGMLCWEGHLRDFYVWYATELRKQKRSVNSTQTIYVCCTLNTLYEYVCVRLTSKRIECQLRCLNGLVYPTHCQPSHHFKTLISIILIKSAPSFQSGAVTSHFYFW